MLPPKKKLKVKSKIEQDPSESAADLTPAVSEEVQSETVVTEELESSAVVSEEVQQLETVVLEEVAQPVASTDEEAAAAERRRKRHLGYC